MLDAKGVFTFGDWTFTTFNQRFVDECAGVFCSVALQVPVDTICDENYFDFNGDFNEDFAAGDGALGGTPKARFSFDFNNDYAIY